MPTYHTQPFLQGLQFKIESFLDTAISQWQMIPHTQFAKRPSPGSWSANECLQHLNSYGRFYIPAIEKAIKEQKQGYNPKFTTGFWGHQFTKMMEPKENGKMKKMKSPKDHRPAVILPSHEVIAEFISQQERLLQLLRDAATTDLGKIKVPISISKFIRLKLGDTFHFLITHEYRHYLQAERALHPTLITQEPIA